MKVIGKYQPSSELSEIDFNSRKYFGTPFAEYYKTQILPKLEENERLRVASILSVCKRFILLIIISITGFFVTYYYIPSEVIKERGYNHIMNFTFAILVIWSFAPSLKYQRHVKSILYPLILKYFGNFNYIPEPKASVKMFADYETLKPYNIVEIEDLVTGAYKGVDLKSLNLIMRDTGSKNRLADKVAHYIVTSANTRNVRYIYGFFIILEFNKKFSSKTVIRTDQGAILNKLSGLWQSNMQRVKLENSAFENEFEVYSTDQVEARYLLSPSFMERLLEVKSNIASPMECSFYDNKLTLLLYDVPFLKYSDRHDNGSFENYATKIMDQIQLIFSIIDTLKISDKNRL